MKNKLMFGAAMIAAAISPAMAHADDTRGSIGAHYNNIDPQGTGNVDVYGLDGSISHDFNGNWTVQGDATTDRLQASGSSVGESFGAVSLGVHGDNHAIYGFAGLTTFFGASATDLGIGGQLAFTNIILNGSVGYADVDSADFKVTEESVDATYFFNDNLGVTAKYGHTNIDTSGPNVDGNIYGLSGSYRLSSTPVQFTLGYEKHDLDSADANVWRVGASWQFGTSSLRDHAQHDFNGARALYDQTSAILF